ncbi:MAG: hypothetical protein ABFS32_07365 [Bacteroidota bacterium]
MEKKRKLIQVYAIIVNVVAIITFIVSLMAFISNLIDRTDPIHSGRYNVDISSFDKYKMDILKTTTKDATYIPTDEEIRGMYEAARADKTNITMHRTFKIMMVNGIVLFIAIILFGSHWWLMKKYDTD